MAILNRSRIRKQEIDLSGPEGNAFVLLGYAGKWGRELGWTQEKNGRIRDEMMSGDYENLIAVFDREFGDFVDLVRNAPDDGGDE